MSEPRVPSHRWFQKQNHVKLAVHDLDKSVIRDSGLDRLPGGAPTPEAALVALFATKRLGYVLDPRDRTTMLQAGSVPVTTNGQVLAEAVTKLRSAASSITSWLQGTVASRPAWADDAIDPDGVDDGLLFPPVVVTIPEFQNLAGLVFSFRITPGSLAVMQVFVAAAIGANVANFRVRIALLTTGAVQFSINDGVARRDFSTPVGLVSAGVPVTLTLFADYLTREAKGFVNGVQQATFTLANVPDLVSHDNNRFYLLRGHANLTEAFNGKLHRAAFLHDRTDAAGRAAMEAWVGEFI